MILKCASCEQKNRVPASRVGDSVKCGSCGAEISVTGKPLVVDPKAFDELVAGSRLPVLVDFWAPWCGPCKMVAPEIEKLAARFEGKVLVAKLNTEDHPEIAQREGVRGIPMFALYKDGERVGTQTGYMSADQLAAGLGL